MSPCATFDASMAILGSSIVVDGPCTLSAARHIAKDHAEGNDISSVPTIASVHQMPSIQLAASRLWAFSNPLSPPPPFPPLHHTRK